MKTAILTVLSAAALPGPVWACAVCFGDKSSDMARAIWPGVLLLLGVVALVLLPIVYLGMTWMGRERRAHRVVR